MKAIFLLFLINDNLLLKTFIYMNKDLIDIVSLLDGNKLEFTAEFTVQLEFTAHLKFTAHTQFLLYHENISCRIYASF